MFEQQHAEISKKARFRERGFGFSLAFFEHVDSHRRVYHAIVGRQSGTIVFTELQAMLADLVRNDLKAISTNERLADLPRNAIVHFVVGVVMSVITWWMSERSKWTPVDVEELFRKLTLPVLLDQ